MTGTNPIPAEPNPPPERRGTKAGRNKGRDLIASALNNVGTASILAAVLQPAVAFVQMDRPLTLVGVLTYAMFLVLGGVFMLFAQWVAKRMED